MLFFGLLALVGDVAGLADPWVGVLGYLARINGLLLVFNLVPALPLDGGRLLHSWLWRRSGDRERATIRAAGAGRVFAIMLISLGVAVALVGDTVGGVWFVAIGWFLLQAVRAEVMSARATQAFTGLRVRDLMTAPPVCLRPDRTVADLAAHLDELGHHPAYPVVADGRYLGTLVLARAGAVPEHRRGDVRVGELMVPADALPVLHPEDEVVEAAQRVSAALGAPGVAHRGEAPTSWVVLGGPSGDEPVAVLSTTDLERVIATADLRGEAGARDRAER
nr:CBS domain-containing protein [Nocardioides panaciterrulae]